MDSVKLAYAYVAAVGIVRLASAEYRHAVSVVGMV